MAAITVTPSSATEIETESLDGASVGDDGQLVFEHWTCFHWGAE